MPQRRKKTVPIPKTKVTTDRLKATLAKCKKTELVDVSIQMAKGTRAIQRQLESQFGAQAPPEELIAATRVAIADATDFDEREINYAGPCAAREDTNGKKPDARLHTNSRPISFLHSHLHQPSRLSTG